MAYFKFTNTLLKDMTEEQNLWEVQGHKFKCSLEDVTIIEKTIFKYVLEDQMLKAYNITDDTEIVVLTKYIMDSLDHYTKQFYRYTELNECNTPVRMFILDLMKDKTNIEVIRIEAIGLIKDDEVLYYHIGMLPYLHWPSYLDYEKIIQTMKEVQLIIFRGNEITRKSMDAL